MSVPLIKPRTCWLWMFQLEEGCISCRQTGGWNCGNGVGSGGINVGVSHTRSRQPGAQKVARGIHGPTGHGRIPRDPIACACRYPDRPVGGIQIVFSHLPGVISSQPRAAETFTVNRSRTTGRRRCCPHFLRRGVRSYHWPTSEFGLSVWPPPVFAKSRTPMRFPAIHASCEASWRAHRRNVREMSAGFPHELLCANDEI